MSQIIIAVSSDWTGLYLNEHLVDQGHDISLFSALTGIIGYEIESVEERELHPVWINLHGQLPSNLNDVVWDDDDWSSSDDFSDDEPD
ncbi:hypothetical protein LAV_00053 [Sphingobium phage Lacusarx]|uniref:Uncharacterized protein n=1 Tax=Sphingobium phage Lacusarx TaxID=1980139 RepID=A0A1W6DX09_9CAUD|nr:hypothetical protein FDH44_gp053 [Sphingobium phage Lacusarx]ARK07453.1 hypothetical protein LAV_00053 [Sphingobium phage Lacusarx]